jgi:predicted membrane metal-binding protein
MRDAGLTHLLSISGLHVSAVIAAVYVLTVRLFALFPSWRCACACRSSRRRRGRWRALPIPC